MISIPTGEPLRNYIPDIPILQGPIPSNLEELKKEIDAFIQDVESSQIIQKGTLVRY